MFDDLNQKPSAQNNPAADRRVAPASVQPAQPAAGAEDMFAEAEPAKPDQFQPKEPMFASSAGYGAEPSDHPFKMQKVATLAGIAAAVLVVAIGAYWGIGWWLEQAKDPSDDSAAQIAEVNTDEAAGQVAEDYDEYYEDYPADDMLDESMDSMDEYTEDSLPPANAPIDEPADSTDEPSDVLAEAPADTAGEPAEPYSQQEDKDQDGLSDEEELRLGLDSSTSDTDKDGLFDREEVRVYGTDPTNPDTDGDGFVDGDEVKNGFNPLGEGKLYSITQ